MPYEGFPTPPNKIPTKNEGEDTIKSVIPVIPNAFLGEARSDQTGVFHPSREGKATNVISNLTPPSEFFNIDNGEPTIIGVEPNRYYTGNNQYTMGGLSNVKPTIPKDFFNVDGAEPGYFVDPHPTGIFPAVTVDNRDKWTPPDSKSIDQFRRGNLGDPNKKQIDLSHDEFKENIIENLRETGFLILKSVGLDGKLDDPNLSIEDALKLKGFVNFVNKIVLEEEKTVTLGEGENPKKVVPYKEITTIYNGRRLPLSDDKLSLTNIYGDSKAKYQNVVSVRLLFNNINDEQINFPFAIIDKNGIPHILKASNQRFGKKSIPNDEPMFNSLTDEEKEIYKKSIEQLSKNERATTLKNKIIEENSIILSNFWFFEQMKQKVQIEKEIVEGFQKFIDKLKEFLSKDKITYDYYEYNFKRGISPTDSNRQRNHNTLSLKLERDGNIIYAPFAELKNSIPVLLDDEIERFE